MPRGLRVTTALGKYDRKRCYMSFQTSTSEMSGARRHRRLPRHLEEWQDGTDGLMLDAPGGSGLGDVPASLGSRFRSDKIRGDER